MNLILNFELSPLIDLSWIFLSLYYGKIVVIFCENGVYLFVLIIFDNCQQIMFIYYSFTNSSFSYYGIMPNTVVNLCTGGLLQALVLHEKHVKTSELWADCRLLSSFHAVGATRIAFACV